MSDRNELAERTFMPGDIVPPGDLVSGQLVTLKGTTVNLTAPSSEIEAAGELARRSFYPIITELSYTQYEILNTFPSLSDQTRTDIKISQDALRLVAKCAELMDDLSPRDREQFNLNRLVADITAPDLAGRYQQVTGRGIDMLKEGIKLFEVLNFQEPNGELTLEIKTIAQNILYPDDKKTPDQLTPVDIQRAFNKAMNEVEIGHKSTGKIEDSSAFQEIRTLERDRMTADPEKEYPFFPFFPMNVSLDRPTNSISLINDALPVVNILPKNTPDGIRLDARIGKNNVQLVLEAASLLEKLQQAYGLPPEVLDMLQRPVVLQYSLTSPAGQYELGMQAAQRILDAAEETMFGRYLPIFERITLAGQLLPARERREAEDTNDIMGRASLALNLARGDFKITHPELLRTLNRQSLPKSRR